jgi:integrase
MDRIVAEAEEPHRTFFAVAAETGMRSGEICGLRVEDMDWQAWAIHIRRSVWQGREQTPKSDAAYREVEVASGLLGRLKDHLAGRKSGYVFQSRRGTPWSAGRVLTRVLHPLLKRLGFAQCGMHAFRHGRVSYLKQEGVPAELIQEWVGHSSLQMTSQYTHFTREYRKKIAAELGSFDPTSAQIDPSQGVPV